VAATIVANAVDLPDHPAIERRPAREIDAASDLGDRLITVAVGPLGRDDVDRALARGADVARTLEAAGLVVAAVLSLDGERVAVGGPGPSLAARTHGEPGEGV
jgi:hypothetical protein